MLDLDPVTGAQELAYEGIIFLKQGRRGSEDRVMVVRKGEHVERKIHSTVLEGELERKAITNTFFHVANGLFCLFTFGLGK